MDVEALLDQYSPPVAATARAVAATLRARLPGVEEQPDLSSRVVGYGYGCGYKGLVCTLILSKAGVKLGFYRGAELPDPHRLLAGKGKVHRYVEVRSPEAAGDPRLIELVDAALAAFRSR